MMENDLFGTDVEFGVNSLFGTHVIAKNLIKASTKEPAGLDGCPEIFELRPEPSNDPKRLLKNVEGLIREIYYKMPASMRKRVVGSNVNRPPEGMHMHYNGFLGEKLKSDLQVFLYGLVSSVVPSARYRIGCYGVIRNYSETKSTNHGPLCKQATEWRPLASTLYSRSFTLLCFEIFKVLVYDEVSPIKKNVFHNDPVCNSTHDLRVTRRYLLRYWEKLLPHLSPSSQGELKRCIGLIRKNIWDSKELNTDIFCEWGIRDSNNNISKKAYFGEMSKLTRYVYVSPHFLNVVKKKKEQDGFVFFPNEKIKMLSYRPFGVVGVRV